MNELKTKLCMRMENARSARQLFPGILNKRFFLCEVSRTSMHDCGIMQSDKATKVPSNEIQTFVSTPDN